MPSTFSWLDYSEHDRRRAMDVIDLFRERDTRDELGIGSIRDALSEVLFPGTSTIQTRPKYFLFIPWVYQIAESYARWKRPSFAQVATRAREEEIRLRHALVKLLDDGGSTVIDLQSIPLALGEEQKLLDKLGHGEEQARLQALGPTEIVETRYPGVWVVVHSNDANEVIGKFIEVCDIPDLLRSQQEDIRDGFEQLQAQLA